MQHILRELVTSARRQAPWWLLGATAVAVVAVMAAGQPAIGFWRWTMIAAAVVTAAVSMFVNKNPAAYGLVILAAIVHLTVSDPIASFETATSLSSTAATLDLLIAVGLVGLLGSLSIRRNGRPAGRDLVEVLVVFLGASTSTWVVVTQPLLDDGATPLNATLIAALLPLDVLIATFMIDLWNDGNRANRAMQMATLAAVSMTVGAILSRLELVADTPSATPIVPLVTYSLAGGFMFAAMSHEQFQHDELGKPVERRGAVSKPRLVIMGISVLVSVTLMGTTAPSGSTDLLARGIGTVLMIALVVARLAIASSEQEEVRAALQRRINIDDLTGLPTRTRFVGLVEDRLEQNWRTEWRPTVLHLNIDRFKHINDSLGHQGANRVLAAIAHRLETAADPIDADVGRLGGDDFVIVDGSTRNLDDAMRLVHSIRGALEEPISIDDTTVPVSTSIGVAIAPEKRATSAEELLRRADVANHQAKLEGASRTAVFDDSMQANVAKRMDLEHALHGAIGRREMTLFHQPIIELADGRVSGFESLIRWRRANGEMVSPGAFISIAEDTGVICELGAWALVDALTRLKEWIEDGVVTPDTTISVNVSPRQVADPNFAQIVRQALDTTEVPARLLWLEITESMMLEEPDLAEATLSELRSGGVRIALDDFGTGFSSLSLLQRFPIDRLKIDRAFVRGIADSANDRSLVRTMIAMAHSMDLDIVAEGVETVHQLQSLRDLGCTKAQGFLISHPVPADAMRSTMSALSELASLSIFAPNGRLAPATDVYEDVRASTPGPSPVPLAAGGRSPLGQPVI